MYPASAANSSSPSSSNIPAALACISELCELVLTIFFLNRVCIEWIIKQLILASNLDDIINRKCKSLMLLLLHEAKSATGFVVEIEISSLAIQFVGRPRWSVGVPWKWKLVKRVNTS